MKVLIAEDETAFRQVLESQMKKEGMRAVGVGNAADALAAVDDGDFDVVVTDLRLPDQDGLDIIRQIRERGHEVPVLLMTAYASVQTAVAALKAGAADYLIKPVRVPDLIRRVQQIHELNALKRENRLLKKIVQQEDKGYWLPATEVGEQINRMVTKVAGTDLTVLITGESGTGKGVTARLLHSLSNRSERPFVPVNCGAMPEQLVESELFGHVKGAFTGADKAKEGLFVAAEGGTLFLDEVGELPPAMQVKLLHAIEEKEVRPVGANRGRSVDVRIVAATNRNLEEMVRDGSFRMDLYYRLNIFQIDMPPLRSHGAALEDAVEFILDRYRRNHNTRDLRLSPEALALMRNYAWPGNLRELENVLERAVILCQDNVITPRDLPTSVAARESGQRASGFVEHGGSTLRERMAAFERHIILQAVEEAAGDRRAAARNLGVGLSTLYRKMEETSNLD